MLFREVVTKSDFGIDLHTAGAERTNYAQVRADLTQPHVASLAAAFGCPLIVDSPGPDRSLRSTAVAANQRNGCVESGGTSSGDDDMRTLARNRYCGGATNPAARAGDHSHPAGEPVCAISHARSRESM